ncbi:restriction endonuclease subunit S [Lactobacillus delbrueckii subsp. lactis]
MKQIPWSSLSARSCRNRRKGCNFAWEQRKLGDVCEPITDSIDTQKYPNEVFAEYSMPAFDASMKPDIVLGSSMNSVRKIITRPCLLVNKLNVRKKRIWYVKKPNKNAVCSAEFIPLYSDTVDLTFLNQVAKSETFTRYLENHSSGSSNSQKRITPRSLMLSKLHIPTIEEQKLIGKIFESLDHTITLHEEKKRQLECLKSALLQKMFADKSGYPVVRFKEFCDEWQGTKLRKISKIVRGASPRPISDPKWFDNDSNVGWLRISDVTSQDGRIHHLKQHISKQGQAKTRVISEPHLLLSIAATVGKPLINYVKIGVHDGFLIFIEPQFDLEFMFQWLEMFRPQWSKYGQPGSQINLNSDLVKNQIIYLPSREEQNQIGIFLNQIDSLINLHQQKINNINSVKKSLLQKMFI